MNVVRVCELAAVAVACRHESTVALYAVDAGADPSKSRIVRWCLSCGALRSVTGWLVPALVEDIGKHLVWAPDDPPAVVDVDPRQIPLPLGMKRRRRSV